MGILEVENDNQDKPRPRLLAEYLPCSRGSIRLAMQKKRESKVKGNKIKHIGEILVAEKIITEEELQNALRRQRSDRLAHCPGFTSLSKAELSAISKHFTEISVPSDKQFIFEGEEDPTMYVLVDGQLEVFIHNENGDEIHIAYVRPVQPIGEMGYFQGGTRTASVRAVTPSELLVASYKNLTHYFEHVPHVAHAFVEMVQRRQAETNRIIEDADSDDASLLEKTLQ
ncbi:MAG: cyclic nucleotide-binding domain-containing protein [Gammaproteobacteria bacterium]